MIASGVIFDFNGTMFFDNDIQENSWRIYLREMIGREITDNEFHEYVHGRNMSVTLTGYLHIGSTENKRHAIRLHRF